MAMDRGIKTRGGLGGLVAKHPITTFFLLTYVLSWWSAPLAGGSIIAHGPFLAAIIVVGLTEGRRGIASFFRGVFTWRGGGQWLVIAPALVLAYLVGALTLNAILGGTITETAHLGSLAPRYLELLLLGGVWEEPGWTGFALPALQERLAHRRYGALQASLILGVFRAVWHIPLVAWGHIPWFDALFLALGMQLLISWVYNRSGRNVLAAMLLHLTSNLVGGALVVPLFSGAARTQFYILFVALACVEALLLARRGGWSVGQPAPQAAGPGGTRPAL